MFSNIQSYQKVQKTPQIQSRQQNWQQILKVGIPHSPAQQQLNQVKTTRFSSIQPPQPPSAINYKLIQENRVSEIYKNIKQIRKQKIKKFHQENQDIDYQDDDQIDVQEIQNQIQNQDQDQIDLNNILQFRVTALQKFHKLGQEKIIPAMVSLILNENEKEVQDQIGVDLICVIDKSGSMNGQKIITLKKCLLVLLDFLSSKDRLCLIEFNQHGQRLTALKKVTEANKVYFKNVINEIQVCGFTNIAAGMEIALNQISKRKFTNNVTSIFVLTDGHDGFAYPQIQAQLSKFVQPITIHSFGFGSDHEADMMTKLCDLRNGSFYFLENISLLDEFFVDALGGLVSVVADQIKIDIQSYPQQPFQEISIGKTYGAMWEKQKDREYKISLQQLATGKRKDYVFELMLPKFDQQIGDAQRSVIVVQAKIQLRNVNTKQIMEKKAELVLTFFNENENIPQNEQDVEVAVQYNRVKSADIIDDAQRACQNNNHELAQQMIIQTISEINKNPAVQKKSQFILEDLEQALEATKPQNFQNYGMKQMIQMKSNNYKQTGMNAKFVGGMQIQMDTAQFQNKKQAEWVTKVKKFK